MENIQNKENKMPKSLEKISYNTGFKDNIQFKKKNYSKNLKFAPRTPLKSNINIINVNQQPLYTKDSKFLKYPLLKSISSSNINANKLNNNNFNNNSTDEEDEKYNENALEDEPEDFIHMNENKITLIDDNDFDEKINNYLLERKELEIGFLNDINLFPNTQNNKYFLCAHFDEKEKKEYDDYFNSPDENDLDEEI